MENKKFKNPEINSSVLVYDYDVESVINDFEHSTEEAAIIYEQKRKLVEDVFANIGIEHYGEVSSILYNKCFKYINPEERSAHIMYRVLMGTIISFNNDKGKFIYDKYDKTLEVFLAHIVYADNVETAINIINATQPDLDHEILKND